MFESPFFRSTLPDIWWHRVPLQARRISRVLSATLTDGLYVTAWPVVGALGPALSALIGTMIGALHSGDTFTFSIILMSVMAVIGGAGAALGCWLLLGYIVGDLFLFQRSPGVFPGASRFLDTLISVDVPLLISYTILAMLVIGIPLTTPWLRQQTVPRRLLSRQTRIAANVALQALVQAALTYVWVQSVPILIRPVYTWRGSSPPISAIRPLQESGLVLVVLAGMVGAARMIAEYEAFSNPEIVQRARALRADFARSPAQKRRLPSLVAVLVRSAVITLLLAGMLTDWLDAAVAFAALVAIAVARQTVVARFRTWVQIVSRVPLAVRLVGVAAVSYLVGRWMIEAMWRSTSTFRPILFGLLLSLAIGVLLVPGRRGAVQASAPEKARA